MQKINCRICSKTVANIAYLTRHIKQEHNISKQDYYDQYLKKDENEGKCVMCGKLTKFKGLSQGYGEHCSNSCATANPETQRKMKETNLKRHGVENASQSEKIKAKKRETTLKNMELPIHHSYQKFKRK